MFLEDNLPGIDPIIIFYFLIVIGYLSGFTTKDNLGAVDLFNACPATDGFFIPCSLFFISSGFNGFQKFQGCDLTTHYSPLTKKNPGYHTGKFET